MDCLRAVLESKCAGTLTSRLHQTQLAGTCDRFGAPLDLEFAKDSPIVSFHRAQGEEQPLANLLIRESGSHEVEDFQLAWAEWLDQGLGRGGQRRCVFALLRIRFQYSQQFPCIVRHHPLSRGCGQEVSHRGTFVDKETDEAARRGYRQRVNKPVYRLVLFAMCLESDRLQHHHLE